MLPPRVAGSEALGIGKPDAEYEGSEPPNAGKPDWPRSGSPTPPSAGKLPPTSGKPSSSSKPALDGLPRPPREGSSTSPRAGTDARTSGKPADSDGNPTSPLRDAAGRSAPLSALGRAGDGSPAEPNGGLEARALTEGRPTPAALRPPTMGR
ncbi:MAG TPA: hypothetical protein VGF76_04290, partial [Polyangiaceae bacterium]